MNWYKRCIYAGNNYNMKQLIKTLALLGVQEAQNKQGQTSHRQFVNPHTGGHYHLSLKGTGREITGGTVQEMCNKLGIPWPVFKQLPKGNVKQKDIDKIAHLLPWNQVQEQIQETPKERPWETKYKLELEQAKAKAGEEERWLEEEIRKEELAKSQPVMGGDKMNWYKKARRGVPGGLADKKKPSDFNKKELERGQVVEMEHTNDKDLSKDISMDHLEEFPTYYTELDKMEKKLEETKPARGGRYPGQQQGDENRPDSSVMPDIFNENELVEGEFVKVLNRMARDKDWDSFNNYLQKLRSEGHSQARVNSMMSRAMHGVKL